MKKPQIKFDYEGMGTCIEADLIIKGQKVLTIGSNGPEHNKETKKIIELIKKYYGIKKPIGEGSEG